MKNLKAIMAAAAASLSLAACGTSDENNMFKSESAIAQEKADKAAAEAAAYDKREQEIAARMVAHCMSAPREELPIKLTHTKKLTDEMNQYLVKSNERCLRGAQGQFFAIYYNREVIDTLAAAVTTAQATAIEKRKAVSYPTQENVLSTLNAARRK